MCIDISLCIDILLQFVWRPLYLFLYCIPIPNPDFWNIHFWRPQWETTWYITHFGDCVVLMLYISCVKAAIWDCESYLKLIVWNALKACWRLCWRNKYLSVPAWKLMRWRLWYVAVLETDVCMDWSIEDWYYCDYYSYELCIECIEVGFAENAILEEIYVAWSLF